MDIFYFSIGGLVIIVALFKRELLVEKESFRIILVVSVVLFFVGIVLHFTDAGRYSASGALLQPLISLGLFYLCRKVFIKRFRREPKDTFFNWEAGLAADRFFNVVYFVLATWLLMLVPFLTQQLAKSGW